LNSFGQNLLQEIVHSILFFGRSSLKKISIAPMTTEPQIKPSTNLSEKKLKNSERARNLAFIFPSFGMKK
jgi:hypothetical protein